MLKSACSTGKVNNYKGHFSAYVYSFSSGSYSLVTPRLNLPSGMRLNFWWKNGYTSESRTANADTTYLEVSTDGKQTWNTLQKYCASTNMLEDGTGLDGLKDLNEWEQTGSVPGEVNYIVLYDSDDDTKDGIWYIKKDSTGYNRTLISDKVSTFLGIDPNMSSQTTLSQYLLWVKDHYPAQHYGLTMILKVTNTGGGTLTINSSDVTITGASANQYAIVNTNFPLSLASGISKNIEIRFVATTGGVKNATLNIAHNAAGSPATVTLAGEAYMPFSSFTDGFETTALDGVPKGWVSNYTGFAYGGVLTTPQNAQSGSNSFGIQNSGSDFVILSTPAVTNFSTNRLTFWAKASAAASTLSVGTIADPYNSGTFASLQTVTLTTSYAQYIVDFSTYSGGAQYIAIKSGGGSTSQFIDNVVWEANPTAPM